MSATAAGPTENPDVAALVEALRAIRAGDVPRPVGTYWFPDQRPSKHNRCIHDVWLYGQCENCLDDFVDATLARFSEGGE